jgi:hypothetical protein
MSRKANEAKSYLSSEGGSTAPIKHRRTKSRAKAAETPEPAVEAAVESQDAVAVDPVAEREEIARLAYLYWESRGGEGGSAEEDWLRAEQEFLKKRAATAF